jgi:N-acetylmuramoyl-L-alanine amidase
LTNRKDEELVSKASGQIQIAEALADACVKCLAKGD